jgi:hypothetical protein
MRQFVKSSTITLLFGCLFLIIGELYIDFHGNAYSDKYDEWRRRRNSIKILLIGNSHIQTNIEAFILDSSAFNMGIGGGNMDNARMMAETYIPQMRELSTVIVNFDYIPLAKDTNKIKRWQIDKEWEDHMSYIHHRYLHVGKIFSRHKYAIPSHQFHFSTIIKEDSPRSETPVIFDSCPYLSFHEITKKDINRITSPLIRIAQIAQEYRKRLIIITTPVHERYLEKTKQENIILMDRIIDSINLIYPLEYKNYLNDTAFRHDDLFLDIHHFNKKGAELFTLQLKKDFNI